MIDAKSSQTMPSPAARPATPVVDCPVPNPQPASAPRPAQPAATANIASQPEADIHAELASETHIISVKDFNLYYGETHALKNINMGIPKSKVTALIGPSGCGKSTLLRSVNRLNDMIDTVRTSGNMYVDGMAIYKRNVDVIELRKRMGMVFQKSNPFPMSIFENVIFSLRIDGEGRKSVLRETAEKALRGAALWEEVKDRLNESGLSLSGGQQQRLCIARAIAAEPEVLLMDEPCSALDPVATSKIEDLIYNLRGNYTVLIVTHSMHQAARVSDYTAFMYFGSLVEYGSTASIFGNPHLKQTEDYVTGRFG